MWAVTSLWPQKVVCGCQIYSASPKLKLISDQAKFVLKAGLCVSLSKRLVYINGLCQLLHVIIYVEKARDS